MVKNVIDAADLPFDQLKVYGITLTSLAEWDKNNLVSFLSFGRSDYRELNIVLADETILSINGKLSIKKISDHFKIEAHFYNKELIDPFNLDVEEIEDIKKGYIVFKKNEQNETILYQRDHDINDIISIRSSELPFKLSTKIIRRAHKNKEIEVGDECLIIDLNVPSNIILVDNNFTKT